MARFLVLCLLGLCALSSSERLFKPFNSRELGKYKVGSNVDVKASEALARNLKEDLGRIEAMCVNRTDIDYFRDPENVKFRCDVVFRCERPGRGYIATDGVSGIRLVRVQCPSGLHFDIERQTCDWRARVQNCDLVISFSDRFYFPFLKTDNILVFFCVVLKTLFHAQT